MRSRPPALGARAAGPQIGADEAVRAPSKRRRGRLSCASAPVGPGRSAAPSTWGRAPPCTRPLRPWGRAPALRAVALRAAETPSVPACPRFPSCRRLWGRGPLARKMVRTRPSAPPANAAAEGCRRPRSVRGLGRTPLARPAVCVLPPSRRLAFLVSRGSTQRRAAPGPVFRLPAQPHPHRIRFDVPHDGKEVPWVAHVPVKIVGLPKPPGSPQCLVCAPCGIRLPSVHDSRHAHARRWGNQDVHMVGYDHPSMQPVTAAVEVQQVFLDLRRDHRVGEPTGSAAVQLVLDCPAQLGRSPARRQQ
jgi:hypothetical protein